MMITPDSGKIKDWHRMVYTTAWLWPDKNGVGVCESRSSQRKTPWSRRRYKVRPVRLAAVTPGVFGDFLNLTSHALRSTAAF